MAASNGMSRPFSATASGYPSGVMRDAFAHSISPARSRTLSVPVGSPARLAAWATIANLESSSCQSVLPTTRGQKYASCRRAAAWNVIACTDSVGAVPASVVRARSLARISPAARWVNVTANTWPGATCPAVTR